MADYIKEIKDKLGFVTMNINQEEKVIKHL